MIIALPVVWAFATYHVTMQLFDRKAAGLIPGDPKISDAWVSANRLGLSTYGFLLPIVIVASVAILARAQRRRYRAWGEVILICVIGIVGGSAGWFAGLVGLAAALAD